YRFAAAEAERLLGQLGDGGCAVLACEGRSGRPAVTIIRHAFRHQVDQQWASSMVVRCADVDRLCNGHAVAERPHGVLAPPDRDLVGRFLRHRDPLTVGTLPGDQLVDHAGGGGARSGDDGGSDAVGVDGGGTQGGDGELVEVVGHRDPGSGGTQPVELFAHGGHLPGQVAAVDAHGAELGSGNLHGQVDGGGDVVGVDQQRGSRAEGGNLGAESVL